MSTVDRLDPTEWIGTTVHVVIDRALGAAHPKFGWTYPCNYGFVPGVFAADGEELDAYVLGADVALAECDGRVVAVVRRRNDVEDKLVVALSGDWDAERIAESVAFQEQYFDSEILTA